MVRLYAALQRRFSLYRYATDIERRFAEHVSGRGAKYTRSHKPVAILYREETADRSAALRREAEIKKLAREEKLKLISEGTPCQK